MGGPTPPYARMAADITDSSASGRSVITGTPAQGATALGLGTGSSVLFGNVRTTGYLDAVYGNGFRVNPSLGPVSEGGDGTWANGTAKLIEVLYDGSFDAVRLYTPGGGRAAPVMLLRGNGTVGIGTVAPSTTLDVAGPIRPGSYTVATLPAGVVGAEVFVSNARKVGEAAGSGTGVKACYSNGAWRRLSDDTAVAA